VVLVLRQSDLDQVERLGRSPEVLEQVDLEDLSPAGQICGREVLPDRRDGLAAEVDERAWACALARRLDARSAAARKQD
jgi:hypothetical protein